MGVTRRGGHAAVQPEQPGAVRGSELCRTELLSEAHPTASTHRHGGKSLSGTVKLFVFTAVWVLSAALLPPAVVFGTLLWRSPWPLAGLLCFYAYRALFPARHWPQLRCLFCLDDTPFWRSQRIVLNEAGFDSAPPEGHLFAFHPHGMLCCGWTLANASRAFRHITWLVADVLLLVPLVSDFLRWHRCESVASNHMKKVLASRRSCALLPGGFEEATAYVRGRHRVFLRQRAGFIKYALMNGYAVHPVYSFGEELTYTTVPALPRFRMWLCSFKVPAVLFWGTWLVPFLPQRDVDVTVVVGPPLQLPRIERPTAEEVAKWHRDYVAALQALFDRHKASYAVQGAAAVLEVL